MLSRVACRIIIFSPYPNSADQEFTQHHEIFSPVYTLLKTNPSDAHGEIMGKSRQKDKDYKDKDKYRSRDKSKPLIKEPLEQTEGKAPRNVTSRADPSSEEVQDSKKYLKLIRAEQDQLEAEEKEYHLRLKGSDLTKPNKSKVQFAEGPPEVVLIPCRENPVEGLESLHELDHLFIHQHMDHEPIFDAWAANERYDILTAYGRRIFFATEFSRPCHLLCCTGHRPFEVNLLDSTGSATITMVRTCRCTLMCCPCFCGNEVSVSHSKTGDRLGSVVQVCGGCRPTLHVRDQEGITVLIGKGDACGVGSRCCHTKIFTLYLPDGHTVVGKISKQERNIDVKPDPKNPEPESFGTSFPIELDMGIKVVLLAACFMVDFAYFGKGS